MLFPSPKITLKLFDISSTRLDLLPRASLDLPFAQAPRRTNTAGTQLSFLRRPSLKTAPRRRLAYITLEFLR